MTTTTVEPPDAIGVAPRTRVRRGVYWAAIGAVLVIVALVMGILVTRSPSQPPLSPTSATPTGAQAIVEVLRDHGVEVTVAASLEEAEAAVADARDASGSDPTVVLHDPAGFLFDERLTAATELSDRLVVLNPGSDLLDEVGTGLELTWERDAPVDASCELPAAVAAGTINGSGVMIRGSNVGTGASDAIWCFGDRTTGAGLVRLESTDATIDLLAAGNALSNERVALAGNAALAVWLLGERDQLVWYTPTMSDVPGAPGSLSDITPPWLTPLSLLLIAVVVAAGLWRGRRFGPLVVEPLPAVVPARETLEGRARLYAAGRSRLHALDALRLGAIGRIAAELGLDRTVPAPVVADAAAALTQRPIAVVRRLLIDDVPARDTDLLARAHEIADLEAEVRRRLRPGFAPPPQPPVP